MTRDTTLACTALLIGATLIAAGGIAGVRELRRLRHAARSADIPHDGNGPMRGHLERVRDLPDPVERETFADYAEVLLDDGLAEVCEETGWHQ